MSFLNRNKKKGINQLGRVHYTKMTHSLKDNFKLAMKTKEIEQPQESTKGAGEPETIGIPDYNAIDTLATYDPTIDGSANIFTSAMLSAGYRLKHESQDEIEFVESQFRRLGFYEQFPDWIGKWYRYGTCYVNLVSEGGNLVKLQIIPPHYIQRIIRGKVEYLYKTIDGKEIKIPKQAMLAFDFVKKKDYAYPMSIFESGLEVLEDAARMNDQFRIIIEEYTAPILHAQVGGDSYETLPSQADIDKIAEDIEESKRIGTELTTDQLVKIAYVQPERGLDVRPFIEWFKEKILLCTMIPEAYTMHRSGAAAGGDSMRQIEAFNNWIRLVQKHYIEPIINNHLIPALYGDIAYDDKGVREELDYTKYPKFEFNPVYEWKLREMNYILKQVGVIATIDQGREMAGLPPLSEEEKKEIMEFNKKPVSRDPSEDMEDTTDRIDGDERDE
jgi:hypothetical protein